MLIPPFTFSQMEFLCKELDQKLKGWRLIASTSFNLQRFWLTFEQNGQQQVIVWCFESPFTRFHLISTLSSSYKAPLFAPIHYELRDCTLNKIELLNEDRILRIGFTSSDKQRFLIGEFFSKHPNYYLTTEEGKILFSLFPTNQAYYQTPQKHFAKMALLQSLPLAPSQKIEQTYIRLEKEWELETEKRKIQVRLSRHLKQLKHRKIQLERQIQDYATWESVRHEGELIKAHFALFKKGLSYLDVWDWLQEGSYRLILDPKKTPQEEMANRFKRAKKFQIGLEYVKEQILKNAEAILKNNQILEAFTLIQTKEDLLSLPLSHLRSFSVPSLKEQAKPLLPYQEYLSASRMLIWVGKNAKGNERLTFSLAKGSDWWLHTQDTPGSHVVIRTLKGKEPDSETIADAIQLALYYSKAKDRQEAEICITQKKYVSRLGKGQIGKVQISKHKTIWARLDPVRHQALKQRRNQDKKR